MFSDQGWHGCLGMYSEIHYTIPMDTWAHYNPAKLGSGQTTLVRCILFENPERTHEGHLFIDFTMATPASPKSIASRWVSGALWMKTFLRYTRARCDMIWYEYVGTCAVFNAWSIVWSTGRIFQNRSEHWQHRQNLIWLHFPCWVPSTISVETFLASGTRSTMDAASQPPSPRFRKSNFTKVPSGMLEWDKEASGRLASNLGIDVNIHNSTWNDDL